MQIPLLDRVTPGKRRRRAFVSLVLWAGLGGLCLLPNAHADLLPHDLDADGNLSVTDVVLTLKFTVGLATPTPDQLREADVAPSPGIGGRKLGDGDVTVEDAVRYLRYLAGFLPSLSDSPISLLRPEAELTSGCYDWPRNDFTPDAYAPTLTLKENTSAFEFTLKDPAGQTSSLSDLLKTKPVFLILASYTCTHFQRNLPQLNELVNQRLDSGQTYADAVHFVLVYTIEAHPMYADRSPFSGAVWELQYSTIPQAFRYVDRASQAMEVGKSLAGNQRVLVDELGPETRTNPIWCTYGPGANPGYLIRQNGVILKAHEWLNVPGMKLAIDQLLSDPK